MEPGTDTWLWERRTLRLFRVKLLNGKSGLFKQINDMIDLYDLLTEFSWPEEWAADVLFSPLHSSIKIRSDNLFRDLLHLIAMHLASDNEIIFFRPTRSSAPIDSQLRSLKRV